MYACLQFVLVMTTANAQWDNKPASVYNPVSTAPTNDSYAYTATDGAGGIIAVWNATDFNTNTAAGVYCQRKTSTGLVLWGDTSNPVILADNFPPFTSVAVEDVKPDGNGGAFITWNLEYNEMDEIRLQHIDRNGVELYVHGGMQIVPVVGNYAYGAKLCPDATGFFVSWTEQVFPADSLVPTYAEVRVQRYNTAGVPQWSTALPVSTVQALRSEGQLVSDGSGGVLIAFLDTRNSTMDAEGNFDNIDLYAQHISSSGSRLWGAQDAVVSTEAYNQVPISDGGSEIFTSITTDSAGGFILVYEDYRSDNNGEATLYAQRMNSSGGRLWAPGGVELYVPFADSYTNLTQVLSDGANGMVACWDINYINGDGDIYVQRITATGNKAWGAARVRVNPLFTSGGYFDQSTLAADGAGAYVAAWTNKIDFSIQAQKINNAGQLQWDTSGVYVCTNPFSAPSRPILTKSNGSNMIVLWGDKRNIFNNGNDDLYAAKINSSGNLIGAVVFVSIANGNWNDPATWQEGMVPVAGVDVVIQTAVVGNTDAVCNTLTVQAPGSLTVNTGIHITVLH